MSFDWMQPKRNAAQTKTWKEKREATTRSELADRAALLHRLGHARDAVKARLTAALAWEAETTARAGAAARDPMLDALDAILNREYGSSGGAAPRR